MVFAVVGDGVWYRVTEGDGDPLGESDGVTLVEGDGVTLVEGDGDTLVEGESVVSLFMIADMDGLGAGQTLPRSSVQFDEDGDSPEDLY